MIEGALAEGKARGEARGVLQGEQKKALEVAQKLLALGIEISIIAEASGLSEAEIISLKKQQ